MWEIVLGVVAVAAGGLFVLGCYLLQADRWRARQKEARPGLTRKGCK